MFEWVKRVFWNLWLEYKGVQHGVLFSLIPPCYVYTNDGGTIRLGDWVSLNHNVAIDAANHWLILIGNNVSIGMNTVLRASNHDYIRLHGHIPGTIRIGDDV